METKTSRVQRDHNQSCLLHGIPKETTGSRHHKIVNIQNGSTMTKIKECWHQMKEPMLEDRRRSRDK